MLTQQATIIKSELYFRLGGFDESYKLIADTKFWIQLSQEPSLHYQYINKECAAYMIQDGQLSSDKTTQSSENIRLRTEVEAEQSSKWDVLKFRCSNICIYIERIFCTRTGKNPFAKAMQKTKG
jgi:hypothetical protein